MQNDRVLQLLHHDRWAGVTGEREAGPFILRFRTPILSLGETGFHVHRLSVVWIYDEEGSGAIPDDIVSERMQSFEDSLCAMWEHDGLAVLTAVLTFDGARQWVFYTRDVSLCGSRLNAAPPIDESYPIELTTEYDPAWGFLREGVLGQVSWQEHQPEWWAALDATRSRASKYEQT